MKDLSSHLVQVVNILQGGGYHDGNSIGKKLNITRSAVWKIVKKLEKYNILINSIKHKGYSLQEPLVLLDKEYIIGAFEEKDLQIEIFESLTSTQTYLKSLMPSKKVLFCISEEQTEGKGRFNRRWHAPFGQNIYLSCIYSFQKDISELSGLSLVIGLAVTSFLKEVTQNKIMFGLKWPNDLMYEGKKVGGILIEVQGESNGTSQALIGIGINVNMLHDKETEIEKEWISLREILGCYLDRNELYVSLIRCVLKYLEFFAKDGLALFKEEWETADILEGKVVEVKVGSNLDVKGIARGINSLGHLILEQQSGGRLSIASGDATLSCPK